MKSLNVFLLCVFSLISIKNFAQVGIGTTNPDPSSILNLESTTSGLLITRLTEAQKNAIPSPATGLLIYQTNNEKGFWYYTGTIWVPFGPKYSFNNGLNESNGIAKLGGNLIENTTISLNNYKLNFQASSFLNNVNFVAPVGSGGINTNTISYNYNGDLVGTGLTRSKIFVSDYSHDVFRVGHEFGSLVDDGNTFNINGDTGNLDYVVKFYDGIHSRGTAMGIGSIEYLVDGEATLGSSVNFVPLIDGFSHNLGGPTNRWNAVYSVNGTIQTSDATLKKEIKSINYGLEEVMKLKPVSYKWKNNKVGNTIIPNKLEEVKLGFLAQEVQNILPEVVESKHWKILDESKPNDYTLVDNERLGMNYSEIIPVLVKAMQEQQQEIMELKRTVKALTAQN